MEIFGYLGAIFMGLALGMTGGGGSILTVPLLVYLFVVPPMQAIHYSLLVVGLTALMGALFASRRGEIDFKTGMSFALPSFTGVYLSRTFLLPLLPDPIFSVESWSLPKPLLIMFIFSIVMIFASVSMIRGRKVQETVQLSLKKKMILIASRGLLVGFVTGFVGAGGGFLIVPALVVLLGLPMKKAVGTSLMIISANSLIGFFGDLKHQTVIDWRLLFSIVFIAMIGLFVGMTLSKKVSEKNLKKGFGYFVLVMAVFILYDQIHKLAT